MSRREQVVLFMAHSADAWSRRQFRRLVGQAGGLTDVFWLWHEAAEQAREPPSDVPVFRVGDDIGKELGYPAARPGIFPGQQVMAVISFSKAFPDYRYY